MTSSDYDFLTRMNISSLDKYQQMHRTLQHINNSIRSMDNTNYTGKVSIDTELNEIENAMSNLESTILNLDAYSRSLNGQLKKIFLTPRITSPR